MKYRVTVKRLLDGRFYARCNTAPMGVCETTGGNREEALEKLRNEIRYQLEWCPCSGVAENFVELDVRETHDRHRQHAFTGRGREGKGA
ncbi:MAG: hypothetical protein D6795_02585 [Deltaproteobacteria bacterium]|nr:MAG: hypothetical protein D6795_02585 [Deltaproteobacteria bacterium]